MKEQVTIKELYSVDETLAKPLLEKYTYPWDVLPHIGDFILELIKELPKDIYEERGENVWIARSAKIYPNNYIAGPCIIGERTEVRPGAFIRGNALVGNDCVVGNSTELKNVILFNHVQVPHYNYVGDSVLGFYSHMGAGSITSNVKADKTLVHVKGEDFDIDTGLKKFGAMLGDHVEIGCNSVLNPGSVICNDSNVYPVSMVRGVVPPHSIYKAKGDIVPKNA
ncbi:MAG: UDP-N-acetylglucosamine pyrophosphorylase [Lachnospiraceae bacterium]|jgi:NDP-sugar pyrophosphorylase family protein|nr:UDP-N-acetylglucosamine pyrophosphorylase [Lachnospiraceae bacterium]